MIYFSIALLAEAKPFIESEKLSLIQQTPFHIYANVSYTILITGMGKQNALIAVSHLLTKKIFGNDDILVNFGLAGAVEDFEIGSLVLGHSLHEKSSGKTCYPDMRLSHPYTEAKITTVNEVQTSIDKDIELVDMEAYGVYQAALFYLKSSQILTFKLISDHFCKDIPSKEQVYNWVTPHVAPLLSLLENYQNRLPSKVKFSATLQGEVDKTVVTLKLTTSQENQFNDALKGFILRENKEPLLPKHLPEFSTHKKEQKDAFSKLINLLNP